MGLRATAVQHATIIGRLDFQFDRRRNIATIEEVGKEPLGVAITPDGKYAYVTARESAEVAVISTQTNEIVESITVGVEPTGVAMRNAAIDSAPERFDSPPPPASVKRL